MLFLSFLLILAVRLGLLNVSSFWVTVLNVTFSIFLPCIWVVLNWIQVLEVWLLFIFWKICWCLWSSVLCFGAQSIQGWWMPKVHTLSNCLLLQGNPRARHSSSAPDAVYLKSSTWWDDISQAFRSQGCHFFVYISYRQCGSERCRFPTPNWYSLVRILVAFRFLWSQ